MKVKSFTQTCYACPSQWEGLLEDDRPFYVRYRWGHLSIDVGLVDDFVDQSIDTGTKNLRNWEEIYSHQLGDDFDGLILWEEVNKIMEGL